MDPTGKKEEGMTWADDTTEETKEDEGRRRPGPDTLEDRIVKAANSLISPYIHAYIDSVRIPLVCVIN
jgi:hypothetical protein